MAIKDLIQELLNSDFCQGENAESASNRSFLEKASTNSGAEYDMIKDYKNLSEIKDIISADRAMFKSFLPKDVDSEDY